MTRLLTVAELAARFGLEPKTVRDVTVHKPGFPAPVYTAKGQRSRRWREDEVMRWETTYGRKAA